MAALATLALGALPHASWAQGKSGTTNQVPTDCAKLTTAQAKDECARAYNQKTTPGTQGTGVGKGQGQGQGVGQGSGQGATQGVGRDNKKP
jgi:hypothetical protein